MCKDGAKLNQLSFQNVVSLISEKIIFFHNNNNIIFIIIITILVLWLIISAIFNKHYYKYLTHSIIIKII